MKSFTNFLLFAATLVAQIIVSYFLAFVTFVGMAEVLNLGASATEPDPAWVLFVVYGLTAAAMGAGMWLAGLWVAKLRKVSSPNWKHFLGAFIAAVLGMIWLESTQLGQMRSPLVFVVGVFVGYYALELVGVFSGDASRE